MKQLNHSIYIDALALVPEKKSGIGYSLEQTLLNLVKQNQGQKKYQIYLVVPLGKAKYLKRYTQQYVKTKTILLPARLLELLLRTRLFPPADWLLGTGTYLFPNYRNWPMWHSRSITYIYDVGFIKFPETVQPKNQKYLKRYINRWVTRTDRIITITKQVQNEIEKELNQPYNKISVVYCGVDPLVFHRRSADEVAATKEKYGIDLKDYFLFVGNIEPRKNLVRLLDAYEKLPLAIQEKYGLLIIGGDGWLSDEFNLRLKHMQQINKKVLRVGAYVNTEDLPDLYSGATALIHPAIYEGFGITNLEAMACGTPVVASDTPAIREIVQESVFYFDPIDTRSLKDAIIRVINDSKTRDMHVRDGKKRTEELTWRQSAAALYETIEDEFKRGSHKRPIISRLKSLYLLFDIETRKMLGDKAFSPYIPKQAATINELRINIYRDFLKEQPSYIQEILLKTYLLIKHSLAQVLKSAYRSLRS
jgi:glycosyltransferase involved in cell wall biosynthesis